MRTTEFHTRCILYVLQELGVRSLEPMDVVNGYVLPQMTQWANRVHAHEAAAAAAVTATGTPSETVPSAALKHLVLQESEAQLLMRLLAFPLAAGLLDMDLQDNSGSSSSSSSRAIAQQQQQQAGQGRGSSATGQQPQHTPRRQLNFSNPAAADWRYPSRPAAAAST
jgi:hypothetical protein